jgi:hypothetical protein
MFINRTFSFLILTLCITFFASKANVNCSERITGFLKGDFNSHPFFFEPEFESYGTGFNGTISGGIAYKRFYWGLSVQNQYVSMSGNKSGSTIDGAWNSLNGYFLFGVYPVEWLLLEAGTGGSWYQSAFDVNSTGIINIPLGGISLLFNTTFMIPARHPFFQHFALELFNTFHLYIHNPTVQPVYNGGLRVHFNPWLQFLTLYVEVSGNTWLYRSQLMDIQSGYFTWGAGVTFDLEFPFTKSQVAYRYRDVTSDAGFIEESGDTKAILTNRFTRRGREAKYLSEPKVPLNSLSGDLLSALKSSIVRVDGFFFNSQNQVMPRSRALLEAMVRYLEINTSSVIGIITWSEDLGDPMIEISVAKERGFVLKRELVEAGINGDRIKVLSSALLYDPEFDNAPYIEIKILESE